MGGYDDFSTELKSELDDVVNLLKGDDDPEGMLVAAYEYIDHQLFPERMGRFLMATVDLMRLDGSGKGGKDNSKPKRKNGVDQDPPDDTLKPYQDWDQAEKDLFPKDGSDNPMPELVLLRITEGSTKWCYYTAAGKKCFTTP